MFQFLKRRKGVSKNIQHPNNSAFGYVYEPLPNAGAQSFAFTMPTDLPLLMFRGAGRVARQYFRPLQPVPPYIANVRVRTSGIPTVAGQYALQGLTTLDAIESNGDQ